MLKRFLYCFLLLVEQITNSMVEQITNSMMCLSLPRSLDLSLKKPKYSIELLHMATGELMFSQVQKQH